MDSSSIVKICVGRNLFIFFHTEQFLSHCMKFISTWVLKTKSLKNYKKLVCSFLIKKINPKFVYFHHNSINCIISFKLYRIYLINSYYRFYRLWHQFKM